MCQHQPRPQEWLPPDALAARITGDQPGRPETAVQQCQPVSTRDRAADLAAVNLMSRVKARRARENRAYVRKLLRQREPEFADALASAEQDLSCLLDRERQRGSA